MKQQQQQHYTYHNDNDVAALQEVDIILNQTRPKHIGEGLLKGIGSIYHGCIGSVGMLVLSPFDGMKRSPNHKVKGFLGGAGMGVLRSVDVGAGGIIQGVGQMVRGVLTTPEAIVAPSRGKWWNDNEGKWITTNLPEERKWLLAQPEFNEDILGDHVIVVRTNSDDDDETAVTTKQVADMYYYDVMEVPPDATEDVIERMYHKLAKRFNPGRAGAGEEAKQQMDEISTAYMILANPEFRQGYDEFGMDFIDHGGLSGHFSATGEAAEQQQAPLVDPYELYAVLFGSEQLQDWIGILGAATAAKASQKLTKVQARTIQLRRVTKLALLLAERLQEYCDADEDDESQKEAAQEKWRMEAGRLVQTSYGNELVNTIGKVYSLCAIQFLGSLENGCGALPSMSAWAKRQYANITKGLRDVATEVTHPAGDWNHLKVQHAVEQVKDTNELEQVQRKLQQEGILQTYLRYLWTRTVLDITDTLHEATQMVLFDQAVTPEQRIQRAHALEALGHLLEELSQQHVRSKQLEALGRVNSKRNPTKEEEIPKSSASTRHLYEEVAFAAMLETCVRKEQEYKRAHTTTTTTTTNAL